jgi:hypothetical protein
MKLITFLLLFGFGFSAVAAPTKTDEEIGLDDIQAELMNEMETVEISDEDEAFLDEELEIAVPDQKTEIISKTNKPATEVKKTVKAPTAPSVKK